MKLSLNKLKVLSLVMMLSFAPAEIAKAQSDASATDCTINYSTGEVTQQCSGTDWETSSTTNVDNIIYENTSPTKIPEPSSTAGILIAVSLGYLNQKKTSFKQDA
jgi:hypothetical protein